MEMARIEILLNEHCDALPVYSCPMYAFDKSQRITTTRTLPKVLKAVTHEQTDTDSNG